VIYVRCLGENEGFFDFFCEMGGETPPSHALLLEQYRFDGAGFFYAGEFGIETLEFEVEPIVIDAHAIQHRGMEVEDALELSEQTEI